jgi:teichuronic acid biosynthesis glycosyltransferase TuaC
MLWSVRIAVLTTSYPRFPGDPSGHFVASEVAAMAQRGDAVTVITPGIAPHGDSRVAARVLGAAFGWPGVAARPRRHPLAAPLALAWVAHARRALSRGGPFDRIVAHWAVPCAFPIADAGDSRVEVVSHGGDVRLLVALPRRVRTAITRRIARRAEAWRFVSDALLETLLGALPDGAADDVRRVARVEPCVLAMPDVTAGIAARRRALEGTRVSVCVGRLVASKRVDAAIADAAARGTVLVVVGDGPERARLEATARRLDARVRFVGRTTREDALAWIGAADEVVHASRAEGLSTVLREADALGVTVRWIA